MGYKVKDVADLVGISVRTLHHYDQIDLLKPESVTAAGYRLYSNKDLERLQQILFFKELDFSLQDIKDILNSPDFDRVRTLKMHKKLLIKKKKRLENIINSVEKTIDSIEGGKEMSNKEMFEDFDMKEIKLHQEKYAEETKKKYGNTDAYAESMKKTSKYTEEDWKRIKDESQEINSMIVKNMEKGPDNPVVQEYIDKFRKHITDSYYNCTLEIFRGLGELYVSDERFTNNLEKVKEGYAEFLREAILIYCDRLEK
ncbi:MerR family transcriptional regulator [Sporosalibacterium faouarense]|uniref:MerR family transcriptional regulator n=1 Tax=Sporosalibacterium faouarense TaxID=516123 RepID=UPI00141C8678|nr:MerR family transcriptional regulator [Sporosalibacterium faouarense]MTI46326.1 MerR family transcriptional regulator [Bacillota bacterium]